MPNRRAAENKIRILDVSVNEIGPLANLEREIFGVHCWSEEQLREEITQGSIVRGAFSEGSADLCGYLIARTVFPEAELLRIGVSPTWRRSAIATRIHRNFVERLIPGKYAVIFLEVRASNRAAILFYENAGYRCQGVRKNYYEDPREDALLFRLDLGSRL
jgi:ribosomal-protein-alanine N-acetyltransferase